MRVTTSDHLKVPEGNTVVVMGGDKYGVNVEQTSKEIENDW